jgi:hypothetical protein
MDLKEIGWEDMNWINLAPVVRYFKNCTKSLGSLAEH